MDLEVITTTTLDDARDWQYMERGDDSMKTIQLDGSDFTSTFTDGRIPSGTPLGLLSGGGGLYGLYDNSDPAALAGFLGRSVQVIAKDGSTHDVGAALYWEGAVIEAKLPAYWAGLGSTPISAGKTDVAGFIKFF